MWRLVDGGTLADLLVGSAIFHLVGGDSLLDPAGFLSPRRMRFLPEETGGWVVDSELVEDVA